MNALSPVAGQPAAASLRAASHLHMLEGESVHIIREVAAECRNPAFLYSIGKDSSVLLHLIRKAFHPAPPPFPLLHVDTGWKFREMIRFRDETVRRLSLDLIVHTNEEGRSRGVNPFDHGASYYTHVMKTEALKTALKHHGFDAVFGGARRDEEKSRAKERIFSMRDEFGQWDPRNQRPELWSLYNGRHLPGEHVRVFPLSNWTELDVWDYIEAEKIALPTIYYAHERDVFQRDGMLLSPGPWTAPRRDETVTTRTVRYRTVGDMSCTGAVLSEARDVDAVIAEVAATTVTERGATRADDRLSEAAMEDRKKEGYF